MSEQRRYTVMEALERFGANSDAELVVGLLGALEFAEARVERARELAKRAKSQAAAPDYDEETIRDLLWALVDEALSGSVVPPHDQGQGGE